MSEIIRILSQIESGDPTAAEQLLPMVYDELRRLAAASLAFENPGQTLNATALVHEAWLRLVGDRAYTDRRHFFRAAAQAMRRILIDRARSKRRTKRGGDRVRVPLSDVELAEEAPAEELLSLNEALEKFAVVEPLKAELVTLRYFVGLSEEEAASALGISRATASRHWKYARAWLINALEEPSQT
jgi:RNA polymerase sigma factor (TIGR02999 family)